MHDVESQTHYAASDKRSPMKSFPSTEPVPESPPFQHTCEYFENEAYEDSPSSQPEPAPTIKAFETYEELEKDLQTDYSLDCRFHLPSIKRPKKRDLGPDRPDGPVIIYAAQLPPDWDHFEPDLDPEDHEAQIERCDERIRKGYMNWIFEQRKERHIHRLERRRQTMEPYPGLSWDVVQHLVNLKEMRDTFDEEKDAADLVNIDAVIEAYQSGRLSWHPRLVTYWAKGKQLCLPRPFNWAEFELIHDKNDGYNAFWVESTFIHLRLDKNHQPIPFSFLDDTGAAMMSIFERDVAHIRMQSRRPDEQSAPDFRNIGYVTCLYSNGTRNRRPVKAVRPNIFARGQWMAAEAFTDWPCVPCLIKPDFEHEILRVPRIIGPWLRSFLYTATAPNDQRHLYISNSKAELSRIPDVDLTTFKPKVPVNGEVAWTIDWDNENNT